jgi:predicted nuclease with TOPRIM domain
MRSEKVYYLTKILNQKAEELKKEKSLLDDRFKEKDEDNDRVKKDLRNRYQELKDQSDNNI